MSASARLRTAALPALLLWGGLAVTWRARPVESRELTRPLASLPSEIAGLELTAEERLDPESRRLLSPDDHVLRTYGGRGAGFELFVAFFGRQMGGAGIHSPRNCLPGSGWEPVDRDLLAVRTPYGPSTVNRYTVEHESGARALVLYWYQGRGRVVSSEYAVKWDLLRDAVLRRRSDEALVRLVFPLPDGEEAPDALAAGVVQDVIDALATRLPG